MQKQTQQKPFSYIEGVAISNQLDRHGAALCVGDTVRIDAIVEDQVEYNNSWVSDMNKYVGYTGKITDIQNYGIKVSGIDNWWFPSTSLVLIRQVEEDNQVEQTKVEPKPLRDVRHNQIILEWLTNPELVLEFKADPSDIWQVLTPNGNIPAFNNHYEYRIKPKKFEKVYKYAFKDRSLESHRISFSFFLDKDWMEYCKDCGITEYTRLDWAVKEVEVK